MKNILFPLFSCLLLAVTVKAQQAVGRLDIQLNKNNLQPGDSLLVTVNYTDSGSQKGSESLATLELMIENEQGLRTRLRWPVINGQASGALHLPDSLPLGKYTLLAGLQQRFFEVRGTIQDPKNSGRIQAMLLTKTGDWATQEVPVARDGTFTIRNWLFEDNAVLAFSRTGNNNQPLTIHISTALDSSYAPVAVGGRTFYVGTPPPALRSTLDQPIDASGAAFADKATVLPAVVVRSTAKSRAQQFNEDFVSALFRSDNERLVDIMDDPGAVGFSNIFSYLEGRIAGLQITPGGFNGGVARWRGSPVTFFLDEVAVPAQQIASIPVTDIAIVKAYPPPFLGAPGGSAGLALYTRRGGPTNYLPSNSPVFKVRGYTPSATTLNMNKPGI